MNIWSFFNQALPAHCVLCQQTCDQLLCPSCLQHLPALGASCQQCGTRLTNTRENNCGGCLQQANTLQRLVALWPYQSPIAELVQQIKLVQRVDLAHFAARRLGHKIRTEIDDLPQALIPVPLSAARWRKRGFNQALEIAKVVSQVIQRPLLYAVARQRHTLPQGQLPYNQRQSNLKDAFCLAQPLEVNHVALVDDVATSLSTLNSVAQCLRQRQPGLRVDGYVLARTQRTN